MFVQRPGSKLPELKWCACSSRDEVQQSPRNTMPVIVTQQGCHFLKFFRLLARVTAGVDGGCCSPQWRTARG